MREIVLQLHEPNGTQKTIVGADAHNFEFPPDASMARADSIKGKSTLRQNLIILNVGVIILGGPFCYFLARRTLRPIEDAIDSQTRFSSDAAHELRTPVAALRVRNEVALRNPRLSLKQAKQTIKDSIDQAIRLEKLSEALLQLSDDSKDKPKSEVHLEDVANKAMNLHILPAQAKQISISDEVPNVSVLGDQQDIVQVISILLDNAIKYSPAGSKVVIGGGKDLKTGIIYVADAGQGIRASDVPRIFDRFYRADHARTTDGTLSYGLGLSIAQKIVSQNKGTLHVHSRLGRGSTFTLRLPLSNI